MKQTGVLTRLISFALLAVMIVTAVPVTVSAEAQYAYLVIPNDSKNRVVNFRPDPKTSDYIDLLPEFWVVELIGKTTSGNKEWYQVKARLATFNTSQTRVGYIMADFVQPMSAEEQARYLANPATHFYPDAQEPADEYSDYCITTMQGVPFRASQGGASIRSLDVDEVLNVLALPAGNTANDWYYCEQNGDYGYVQADGARLLRQSELGEYTLPPAPQGQGTAEEDGPVTEEETSGVEEQSGPLNGTITGYVKLVKGGVNIRKTPGGTILTPTNDKRVSVGTILPYVGIPSEQGGYNWVYTSYNGIIGYVRSDCYIYCDEAGNPTTVTPTAVPEDTPAPGEKFITLTKGGVNVRKAPGGQTTGIQLAKGTILKYTAVEMNAKDGTLWFYAYVPRLGNYGYILSTMGYISDSKGHATGEQPSPQPKPTPTGSPVMSGYIITSVGSVWVRSYPVTNASTLGQIAKAKTILPMSGAPVYSNPYTWYPIRTDTGATGYIRGDCAYQLAEWQYDYYVAHGVVPTNTPAPPAPKPGNSSYVITTDVKLWVRATPSTKAATLAQIKDAGTVIKFTESQKVGSVLWYRVNFNGENGWVHGNFVHVMTNAEYEAYIGTLPTSTPKPTPTPMPDPSKLSDVALTTADRVKLRKTGSMSGKELVMVENDGSELKYLGNYTTPTSSNPYTWFNVQYRNVSGWMRGDFVRVLTQEEKAVYLLAGDPDAPKEASYRTLSQGDSGDDVRLLNKTLYEKGLLAEQYVTDSFSTETEKAVLAFQRANKLTVDGIAGEKTQHALYNTVPVGTYSGGSTESILYPVELVDWYKGDIQKVWKVGVIGIVTDVYTGIAWKAQRLYGDAHADVEPATKEDTAAYCRIYKVSNPQEIVDREQELQSYRRRPLWVTIGNRTFAASLYGEPHNFAGDRIPDNGFNGQVCIHFVNSRTHESDVVDYDRPANGNFGHQSAIKYAYEHAKEKK